MEEHRVTLIREKIFKDVVSFWDWPLLDDYILEEILWLNQYPDDLIVKGNEYPTKYSNIVVADNVYRIRKYQGNGYGDLRNDPCISMFQYNSSPTVKYGEAVFTVFGNEHYSTAHYGRNCELRYWSNHAKAHYVHNMLKVTHEVTSYNTINHVGGPVFGRWRFTNDEHIRIYDSMDAGPNKIGFYEVDDEDTAYPYGAVVDTPAGYIVFVGQDKFVCNIRPGIVELVARDGLITAVFECHV